MGNSRFKCRVWDKVSKRYFYLELKFGDNGYHPDFITDPVFEQCTGLKDKNGNLIYEGDILLLRNNKFEVGNNNITVFFKCLTDKYTHIDPLDFDYNESEIIGNIHNQPGQKDK